jgi:hypothetical protein
VGQLSNFAVKRMEMLQIEDESAVYADKAVRRKPLEQPVHFPLGSEQAGLFFVGVGQSHPLNVVPLRFEVGNFIQVHAHPSFTGANKYKAVR